ncbi:TPA: hypothetical protein ACF2DS_002859 [Clostridium perfringens]|uniref:Uncharacterized protein n=5 Tax=Bacillota TaxID=1239 RepID=F7J094_CLOPF|nr:MULTISPECIES: hypothetical protein [Bacillota]EDT23209.1 hypothetical protein AC1_A0116 [Clostridium perfringens B str. ATCC 3626]EDT70082.1 hypothetical protein CJD_A0626 [Clostridium perfringens D str. JGS1721]EDT70526.1 hypothetical protein CJD_A0544 [Clostridium perfringens D str. JGS1721]EDT71773.1 hypothetical protein CJD_A0440 [Clostridium perfringens D str. JGS1721]ELC8371318.1 hypothetical protein [Clostridium perfringens]
MYEKPIILTEQQEKDSKKYVCGTPGCSCEPVMNSDERYCHFIGAYYCWCKEGLK